MPTPAHEQQIVTKIALYGLLGALPVSAGLAVVAQGDSVMWAQLNRALDMLSIPEAQAGVTHAFPAGWTNNPNGTVIVDCDCPPPDCSSDCGRDGGGGDGGASGDSCDCRGGDSDCCDCHDSC